MHLFFTIESGDYIRLDQNWIRLPTINFYLVFSSSSIANACTYYDLFISTVFNFGLTPCICHHEQVQCDSRPTMERARRACHSMNY